MRELSGQQEEVLAQTEEVLRNKGKGVIAPLLPLYMRVATGYEESWLSDKLEAYLAVQKLSLGDVLLEIQDAGHNLPRDVVNKLLDDASLLPRPTPAEVALMESMVVVVRHASSLLALPCNLYATSLIMTAVLHAGRQRQHWRGG